VVVVVATPMLVVARCVVVVVVMASVVVRAQLVPIPTCGNEGDDGEDACEMGQARSGYWPVKSGFRFSVNAATASIRSSEIRYEAFHWAT